MTTCTYGTPLRITSKDNCCKQCTATKNQEQKRVERQAKAKERLDALKRKAAGSCFCYVE